MHTIFERESSVSSECNQSYLILQDSCFLEFPKLDNLQRLGSLQTPSLYLSLPFFEKAAYS